MQNQDGASPKPSTSPLSQKQDWALTSASVAEAATCTSCRAMMLRTPVIVLAVVGGVATSNLQRQQTQKPTPSA